MLPHLIGGEAALPWTMLLATLLVVLAVGLSAGLLAVRAVLRAELLPALSSRVTLRGCEVLICSATFSLSPGRNWPKSHSSRSATRDRAVIRTKRALVEIRAPRPSRSPADCPQECRG